MKWVHAHSCKDLVALYHSISCTVCWNSVRWEILSMEVLCVDRWKYLNLKDDAGFAFFSFYCSSHTVAQILYITAGNVIIHVQVNHLHLSEGLWKHKVLLSCSDSICKTKGRPPFSGLCAHDWSSSHSFVLPLCHHCLQSNKITLHSALREIERYQRDAAEFTSSITFSDHNIKIYRHWCGESAKKKDYSHRPQV